MSSSSVIRDRLDSDSDIRDSDEEEDRFDLPTFKLPVTPAAGPGGEGGAKSPTDTPEMDSASRSRTRDEGCGTAAAAITTGGEKQRAKGGQRTTSRKRKSDQQISKDKDGGSERKLRRSGGENKELKKKGKVTATSKEPEALCEKKCKPVKICAPGELNMMTVSFHSLTQAILFESQGFEGHEEDSTKEEKVDRTGSSSDRKGKC